MCWKAWTVADPSLATPAHLLGVTHRADADVQMLAGILAGLQQEMRGGPTGWAVYALLARANDRWAALLSPPIPVVQAPQLPPGVTPRVFIPSLSQSAPPSIPAGWTIVY